MNKDRDYLLQQQIEVTKESFVETTKAIETTSKILNKEVELTPSVINELQSYQRSNILQSFRINKLNKLNKINNKNFLDQEFGNLRKTYLRELSKTEKINYNNELDLKRYEKLQKKIQLPIFKFSIETVTQYNNGELLNRLTDEQKTHKEIKFDELFNLDLNKPNIDIVKTLLKIEKRIRISKHIRNDLFLTIKQSYIAKNKKWLTRDSKLNKFLDKDLQDTIDSVKVIKKHDEDLRYDDADADADEDVDVEEEEDEEKEDYRKEAESQEVDKKDDENDDGKDDGKDDEKDGEKDDEKTDNDKMDIE